MLKKIILLLALMAVPIAGNTATVQLPRTGQADCWSATGSAVSCAGTGQDGESRTGVIWPAPRFADNRDGTVTDNLTGLIWMQNANCASISPKRTWDEAIVAVRTLQDGVCGLSDKSAPGQWRLPNVVELESLVDAGQSTPAFPPTTVFIGLRTDNYRTSTTHANSPDMCWNVNFLDGSVFGDAKIPASDRLFGVWAVRGGQ